MPFNLINMETWVRKEHFLHYMNHVRCTYSLTTNIDITVLRNVLKQKGLKAYPAQIHMLATIVNHLPEFRMGLTANGLPGYWSELNPSYTVFNSRTKTFSSIWTQYYYDFHVFYLSCIRDIEKYGRSTSFSPKGPAPDNTFPVSSIPWINFSAFNLNIYAEETYLLPIFTLGKYIEKNGKTLLPLTIQVHHAACDGYHIGQFIENLQLLALQYDEWL